MIHSTVVEKAEDGDEGGEEVEDTATITMIGMRLTAATTTTIIINTIAIIVIMILKATGIIIVWKLIVVD